MSLRMRHASLFCCLLLLSGLLGACSEPPPEQPALSVSEVLRQRASARWRALISQDWQAAYELEAPAYRAVYNLGDFVRRFGAAVTWTRAEVTAVTVADGSDAATVEITLWYRASSADNNAPAIPAKLRESWVMDSGVWWYLHKSNKMLQNEHSG